MGLLTEYINKKLSVPDLELELLRLISEYNEQRNTYLFLYASAAEKGIPIAMLQQSDFYTIRDMLANKTDTDKIDFYIETLGGGGETAEEIVRFLHDKFDTVSFVISGEAKSAGTIMVLSGDDILMTETGSLGPIDAQVKIGRSRISAYDYLEWVDEKRKEAQEQGSLNPFDATMIAQITPGELNGILHALKFAEDLVIEWLANYKFKKWTVTETRKIPVTWDMKLKRAQEIAEKLNDHSLWRSHGRSIKIEDLEGLIGLQITKIDNDIELADTVYRIQTVCRLLFENSTIFKIFATQEEKIFRHAVAHQVANIPRQQAPPDIVEIVQPCPKCGKQHKIYGKLAPDAQIDVKLKKKGFIPFPKDSKMICDCSYEIDLSGVKNNIEIQTGKKILT